MRMLVFHVDRFASKVTERGRSRIIEEVADSQVQVGEALVVLTSVEARDEADLEKTSIEAAREVESLANQLKVRTIVIHPFAHLFAELSSPEAAVKTFANMEHHLKEKGFEVKRTPFGWFNTLEMKAKGHPLLRVARIISAEISK